MCKHPLDGAVARIGRAERHILEAESIISEYAQRISKDHFVVDYDPVSKNEVPKFTKPKRNFLIPVAVGDVIYNLRSALDYLVYELAREDSGLVQEGTQFPIEDVKNDSKQPSRGFDAKIGRYLRGLSQPHVDAIEKLQPYMGADWTKTLREISNPDKHRELISSKAHIWTIILTATGDKRELLAGRGRVFSGAGPDGCDVQMDTRHVIDIRFSNGLRVIETLKMLHSQVSATIDAFKSEFKV